MKSFVKKRESKAALMERLAQFRERAAFIARGYYYEDGQGTMLGCVYASKYVRGDDEYYKPGISAEDIHGIPADLSYMAESVYRGLSHGSSPSHHLWPERFYGAIREGAELVGVARAIVMQTITSPDWFLSYACPRASWYAGQLAYVMTGDNVPAAHIAAIEKNMRDEWHITRDLDGQRDSSAVARNAALYAVSYAAGDDRVVGLYIDKIIQGYVGKARMDIKSEKIKQASERIADLIIEKVLAA